MARKDASRGKSPAKTSRSKSPAASASPEKRVKKPTTTAVQVLFFYPNLIGYLRIACMLGAFCYADHDWKITLTLYLLAFGGDVVDGWFARRFNQSSTFGGVLDMVTDRVSTCGLLYFIGSKAATPQGRVIVLLLIVLDIFSHWFHVASVSGHHKSKESLQHRNALLQWYYSIYPLFGFACVGTELLYVYSYLHLMRWGVIEEFSSTELLIFAVLGSACLLKQAVNVVQLVSAAYAMAEADAAER